MKFTSTLLTSALLASVPAFAAPQEGTTVTTTSSITSMISASTTMEEPSTSTSVSMSPQQSCIMACPNEDTACKASCITVPAPNDAMANQTTECARNCPQGSGSPEDTEAYSKCVQDCIGNFFISTNTAVATGTPAATTMTNTRITTTGTATTATVTSGTTATASAAQTDSQTGSRTGSATSSSRTSSASGSAASAAGTNAAGRVQLGSSVAGVAGLLLAAVAL